MRLPEKSNTPIFYNRQFCTLESLVYFLTFLHLCFLRFRNFFFGLWDTCDSAHKASDCRLGVLISMWLSKHTHLHPYINAKYHLNPPWENDFAKLKNLQSFVVCSDLMPWLFGDKKTRKLLRTVSGIKCR